MGRKLVEERPRRIFSYLRVSTIEQDTGKNKADVLEFANRNGFLGGVTFVEEKVSGMKSWKNRKLADLVYSMAPGDVLIVPELSRLGRSLIEVLQVLTELKDRSVSVYSVKENFKLNGDDMQSKVMRTMLGLFSEIEHDLIVARTKEGLAEARSKGHFGGRPKGPGKSKLDKFRPEIESLLQNGSTKTYVANRYKVAEPTLYNWLAKNKIDTAARLDHQEV